MAHDAIYITLHRYNVNVPKKAELSIEAECDYGLFLLNDANPEYPSIVRAI
jgi:hypothetical protein